MGIFEKSKISLIKLNKDSPLRCDKRSVLTDDDGAKLDEDVENEENIDEKVYQLP